MAICPGIPGWAGTRRNLHPFTHTRKRRIHTIIIYSYSSTAKCALIKLENNTSNILLATGYGWLTTWQTNPDWTWNSTFQDYWHWHFLQTGRLFESCLNKEDALDHCKWRKVIKEVCWPRWVWACKCFFWYRPTWVVPDKRPLNGCCCCCWKVGLVKKRPENTNLWKKRR